DEEFARADHDRAGGRMADGLAAIGRALGDAAHLLRDGFELAAPDIFEIDALRLLGGGLVEIDRHLQSAPDFSADAFGQPHAFLESDTFNRDERYDVSRADARVRALVFRQVDEFDGLFDRPQRRFRDRPWRADERQDAA